MLSCGALFLGLSCTVRWNRPGARGIGVDRLSLRVDAVGRRGPLSVVACKFFASAVRRAKDFRSGSRGISGLIQASR